LHDVSLSDIQKAQKFVLSVETRHPSFSLRILMDNDKKSSSPDPTLIVATEAQQTQQPRVGQSPWVRVVACLAFAVVAVTLGITIGFFCRVVDFDIVDKNLGVTDATGGAVSIFNFYWEPYV
jgi:hypothetical protein